MLRYLAALVIALFTATTPYEAFRHIGIIFEVAVVPMAIRIVICPEVIFEVEVLGTCVPSVTSKQKWHEWLTLMPLAIPSVIVSDIKLLFTIEALRPARSSIFVP